MKIAIVTIPYDAVPDPPPEGVLSVEWGMPGGDDLVSPPLHGEKLDAVLAALPQATERDVTAEYEIGWTKAPEAYDGFGTFTVESYPDGWRKVAVRLDARTWQTMRYSSGLGCYTADPEMAEYLRTRTRH